MKELNKRKTEGQSFTELSVLILILILLVAGVADFGRAYFTFVQMRDAAQEGASFGSYSPTEFSAIEDRIRDTMKHPIDMSDPSTVQVVTSLTNPGMACAGFDASTLEPNKIEISILYDLPIITPFLGAIIGNQQIPLTATVTNTILQPQCN